MLVTPGNGKVSAGTNWIRGPIGIVPIDLELVRIARPFSGATATIDDVANRAMSEIMAAVEVEVIMHYLPSYPFL